MIYLTRINMLPYRAIVREGKKKEFQKLLLIAAMVALLISLLVYYYSNQQLDKQRDRNNYLSSRIDVMDAQVKKYNRLEDEKAQLLTQQRDLENLQTRRFLIAKMLNDLDHLVPRGMQLITLRPAKDKNGMQYELQGKALTDAKVALFLRQIGSTHLFSDHPVMNEIQTKNGVQNFTVTIQFVLDKQRAEEEKHQAEEAKKNKLHKKRNNPED
ncbi:MAG: hypothetical protein DI620_04045 [Haemophilus parainfluenzae]|jgi:type IV pilus assembly protein pilN|nr:MAG: hypothetical protein DI620_04045 [Haemophilus parainfluenzae]